MKLQPYLPEYTRRADEVCALHNLTRADIIVGRDAWTVAHLAGIYPHALALHPSIVDAQVQTALEAIFPNVVFKDKKVY